MPAHALSERAARAALAAHFAPGQLSADLAEYTPAEVWDRRVRSDGSGRLAHYRPHEELAQAELTCPFVIPSDQEWPTALADLGPACPLGLWVRGRERLPRLTGSPIAVTGNRVPTEQAVARAHDFATALAEADHTVTATLAYHVDSTAHQAAAETGRATLAVLPRGLDSAHLWAVAPDVPMEAAAILAESLPWLEPIRALGIPASFAAQDGSEHGLIPWDSIDVLFLAGSTEWKTSPAAHRLAVEARERGLTVHMCRVHSRRRLRIAQSFGCTSCDGTCLVFGPDTSLPRPLAWMNELHTIPTLLGDEA